jgi:hypothetical protein
MTVKTMDAPVAFARNNTQTGWKSLGQTRDGGELWSFKDLAIAGSGASVNVATNAVANTFGWEAWGLSPLNSNIFPNFAAAAAIWERWRPSKVVLHYCHFAPTSTQAAVMLFYLDDPTNTADIATSADVMALENSVQGNAYEDFSLEIRPAEWRKGQYFYTDYLSTGAEVSGVRQVFAGVVGIATDMNTATSLAIGRWYVEMQFEVCEKRPPIAEIAALAELKSMLGVIPPEHRRTFLNSFIGPRVVDLIVSQFHGRPANHIFGRLLGYTDDVTAYMEHVGLEVPKEDVPLHKQPASQVLQALLPIPSAGLTGKQLPGPANGSGRTVPRTG